MKIKKGTITITASFQRVKRVKGKKITGKMTVIRKFRFSGELEYKPVNNEEHGQEE